MAVRTPIQLGGQGLQLGAIPPQLAAALAAAQPPQARPAAPEQPRSTARAYGVAEALAQPIEVTSGSWVEALAEGLAGGLRGRAAMQERQRVEGEEARERKMDDGRRLGYAEALRIQGEGGDDNAIAQALAGGDPQAAFTWRNERQPTEQWSEPFDLNGAQVQRNARTNQLRSVVSPPSVGMVPGQWGPMTPQTQAQYPGLNPGDVQQNQVTGEIRQIPGAAQRQRFTER